MIDNIIGYLGRYPCPKACKFEVITSKGNKFSQSFLIIKTTKVINQITNQPLVAIKSILQAFELTFKDHEGFEN